jgi:hypothetical protein
MVAMSRHFRIGRASRGRVVALGLTLLIHVLLLLALLNITGALPVRQEIERRLLAFSVTPEKTTEKRDAGEQRKRTTAAPRAEDPRPIPPTAPRPTPEKLPPLPILQLDSQTMASADIGKLARPSGTGGDAGRDSATSYGPGEGPGGAQLFDAEWYREPTSAELAFYMPKSMPKNGWGLVACRTVADFRVDDCRQLDENPKGSGLARAVRQAAWQFRVRPPRIGGKPVIGAWVRIRITYSQVAGAD